jgi:hypothetical protein
VDLGQGSAMTSPELGLTAAPRHGSSLVMAQRRERSTGSPTQASPGRGQCRGDRATTVKKQRWRRSVEVVLELSEERRRAGTGAVKIV